MPSATILGGAAGGIQAAPASRGLLGLPGVIAGGILNLFSSTPQVEFARGRGIGSGAGIVGGCVVLGGSATMAGLATIGGVPTSLPGRYPAQSSHQHQHQDLQEGIFYVVCYGEDRYVILPELVVDEKVFWLGRGWLYCTICLVEQTEAELGGATMSGQGGGGGGRVHVKTSTGGDKVTRKCQCTLNCQKHQGQACHAEQQNATSFCSACQVKNGLGCHGVPGKTCKNGRQAKVVAMDRWACQKCTRELGFVMKNELTDELRRRGLEVVRLVTQVHVPASLHPAEYEVQARFANEFNGQMRNAEQMNGHRNAIVSTTKNWVMGMMPRIVDHQPEAQSCLKVQVAEVHGQVTNVQLLGVKVWGDICGVGCPVDLEALVKHPDFFFEEEMATGIGHVGEENGNDSDAFFALSPSQGAM